MGCVLLYLSRCFLVLNQTNTQEIKEKKYLFVLIKLLLINIDKKIEKLLANRILGQTPQNKHQGPCKVETLSGQH